MRLLGDCLRVAPDLVASASQPGLERSSLVTCRPDGDFIALHDLLVRRKGLVTPFRIQHLSNTGGGALANFSRKRSSSRADSAIDLGYRGCPESIGDIRCPTRECD